MRRRSFLLACAATPLLHASKSESPASEGSWAYSLTADGAGGAYLVWTETADGKHALRVSRWEDGGWSPARTIATGGEEWFVNTLDHPAVGALPGGRLMVNWMFRPEAARGAKYGYGFRAAYSDDYGASWKQAFESGADNVSDYTGFVGFAANERGFQAAYLAPLARGEAQRDAAHVKTLRFA